jgi:diadenosine tetraphosphatase ApaH/serine/threonine PP2A family protein phosphatase
VRSIQVSFPNGVSEKPFELSEREQYLINPGSVGQPRDGNPRAAYAFYDDAFPGVVEYCRVAYDVARAQQKIRAAGLPPRLADRLAAGR